MALETKNLETMKRDVSLGQQIMKYLDCMRERNTESFLRYNKNREKDYRQLEADSKKILIRYMERVGETAKQSFSKAMQTYLAIVENGRFDEEKQEKLWETQCTLAMPMWRMAGEDNGPGTESESGAGVVKQE